MKIAVVIPNFNGRDMIGDTIKSLKNQSIPLDIVVVENNSSDGSFEYIEQTFPEVAIIKNDRNLGFAGGVNAGIHYSIEKGYEYVALLNNDACADKEWLRQALSGLEDSDDIGIVTSKILSKEGKHIDSAGIAYTSWGLPYPIGNGRNEKGYTKPSGYVFAASGGASLFRSKLFLDIGYFDEDFFAYYEDVDLSFRSQLAGWKVWYEATSIVYHATGSTSSRYKGFTTYQTLKNLPWLFWKNVPASKIPSMFPKFLLAHMLFYLSALKNGHLLLLIKAFLVSLVKFPLILRKRKYIQRSLKVDIGYITSIIENELPPNATNLRKLFGGK